MPTYDYLCDACGFRFEEFQSIASEPLQHCPRCGSYVRRLISGGGGIIFKGSGFYETDYKRRSFSEPSTSQTVSEKVANGTDKPKAKKPEKTKTKAT
jgi:putative FmdB family regulatory protein